jgi:hypothetical protein
VYSKVDLFDSRPPSVHVNPYTLPRFSTYGPSPAQSSATRGIASTQPLLAQRPHSRAPSHSEVVAMYTDRMQYDEHEHEHEPRVEDRNGPTSPMSPTFSSSSSEKRQSSAHHGGYRPSPKNRVHSGEYPSQYEEPQFNDSPAPTSPARSSTTEKRRSSAQPGLAGYRPALSDRMSSGPSQASSSDWKRASSASLISQSSTTVSPGPMASSSQRPFSAQTLPPGAAAPMGSGGSVPSSPTESSVSRPYSTLSPLHRSIITEASSRAGEGEGEGEGDTISSPPP